MSARNEGREIEGACALTFMEPEFAAGTADKVVCLKGLDGIDTCTPEAVSETKHSYLRAGHVRKMSKAANAENHEDAKTMATSKRLERTMTFKCD